jgi:hypothetical protein
MKRRYILFCVSVLILSALPRGLAENIDPYNDGSKYAYGENVGWFNFKPSQGPGVTVRDGKVIGYVWQENIGWINLSPTSYGGVTYDSKWRLSGYAWSENLGWINFNPTVLGDTTHYGVVIDSQGNFSGWAWGENIGWIHLNSTTPVAYKVRACVVSIDDLAHFAQQWLMSGPGFLQADLNHNNQVDFVDYSIFSSGWLDFCADNWPLK